VPTQHTGSSKGPLEFLTPAAARLIQECPLRLQGIPTPRKTLSGPQAWSKQYGPGRRSATERPLGYPKHSESSCHYSASSKVSSVNQCSS
jgi:hypothetical protein